MNRKFVLGGVVVVLVVASALGAAVYTGAGPAPGGDSGETIEEFPSDDDAASADETDAFSFAIDEIEECGQTCRDVTATLENDQNESASDVTVYTRIYAGADSTDTDDFVWEGSEAVGNMEAGSDHTSTERVELSLQDARKIDQEDGWITVVTTVQSDDTTITFQENRQVA